MKSVKNSLFIAMTSLLSTVYASAAPHEGELSEHEYNLVRTEAIEAGRLIPSRGEGFDDVWVENSIDSERYERNNERERAEAIRTGRLIPSRGEGFDDVWVEDQNQTARYDTRECAQLLDSV